MQDEFSSASARLPDHMLANVRLGLCAYGTSEVGSKRTTNEDAHAYVGMESGGQLLVVCDGDSGPRAAQLAVQTLLEQTEHNPKDLSMAIREALVEADTAVLAELCTDSAGTPGSTGVVVGISDGWAHIGWVGDSRAYLIRRGEVLLQTRDHRLLEDLIAAGSMTREQALQTPMAKLLSRRLGGRVPDGESVRPSLLPPVRLEPDDLLLVCSDGLTETLSDDTIVAILTRDGTVEEKCEQLVDLAIRPDKYDDVTVLVAECKGVRADAPVLGESWDPHASARLQPDYDSDLFDVKELDLTLPFAEEKHSDNRSLLLLATIGVLAVLLTFLVSVAVFSSM